VAKHILIDAGNLHLLPDSQFGSRDYHCAMDAALSLVHSAQSCAKSGHVASLILFDIQGFYDNLHVNRLVHLFQNLGFAPSLCGWVRSFLTDCRVSLSFNGSLLPEITLNHSTPQGSPLSPILSAIYTSPLLHLAASWRHRSLSLYVDNSSILATGATHHSANTKCADGFTLVVNWLNRNGLTIDSDKTEFISFYSKRISLQCIGMVRLTISLSVPGGGVLEVCRSTTVQYLGIFLSESFSWEHHAKVMAAWARSTTRALQVMGNSVHGLDFANWRKVYHTIILPILTYGLALWSDRPPKSLLDILQVVQNDVVRCISGTFRTTPTLPLHHMLAIPPIKYMVTKLCQQAQLRLTRLPPNHKLCTVVSSDQTRFHPDFISVPTPLTSLLPSVFPPFYCPLNRTWSHPQLSSFLTRPCSDALSAATIRCALDSTDTSTSIFLYPLPHPDHYVTAFIIAQDNNIIAKGFSMDTNKLHSNAKATTLAAQQLAPLPHRNTTFFLPSPLLHAALLSLHKHNNLPSASSFTATLSVLLHLTPVIYFSLLHLPCKLPKPPKPGAQVPDPRIFSHNWPGPPRKNHILDELRIAAQSHTLAPPPTPPKLFAFQQWQADNPKPIPCKWAHDKALPISDTPEPLPFMRGTLSLKQQGASSLALQVLFKH